MPLLPIQRWRYCPYHAVVIAHMPVALLPIQRWCYCPYVDGVESADCQELLQGLTLGQFCGIYAGARFLYRLAFCRFALARTLW